MKKILALILVGILALSLVACGGDSTETGGDDNGKAQPSDLVMGTGSSGVLILH